MKDAYLSLGSNEGNREQWLKKAIDMIGMQCGPVTSVSSVYETAAWGITDQPDFLNMVIHINTRLHPQQLLAAVLEIELALGRVREVKWGPRIIDIDVLTYGKDIVVNDNLTIPHPWFHERRFVLAPFAEIAPLYEHPVLHKTVDQLLTSCTDPLHVALKGKLS